MGRWLCLGGGALGILGLLGGLTGADFLTTFVPGRPPMRPTTGLALLLLGVAGALRLPEEARRARRAPSWLAALVVLAFGSMVLAGYALGLELRIDRLFTGGLAPPYHGRPAFQTALALALLAAALLCFDTFPAARVRPSEWLVLAAGVTTLAALFGHLFGAAPLYRLAHAPLTGVAVSTAISLLLLCLGLLLERPGRGVMRMATSPGAGGAMLRRLVPPAILAPAVLGYVAMRLVAALGAEDLPLEVAVFAALMAAAELLLLLVTAASLERAHAALESSRTSTRALLELAPDGIFVADLSGRYTDVNDAGCRMLGRSREEIVGKTIVDLLPPEDAPRLQQSKERMLGGAIEVGEWRLRRKDGTYLPAEVSAKILPDGRWQGFVRDISERVQAAERLRLSRERFELALRGADLAAWDWNVPTGEVIFNARWAEMRGFRPEEIRPHVDSWTSGVHPDDLPGVRKALEDYFEGRIPEYATEHRVRTASGGWIWILDRGKVFARDERGRPTRMAGTELDITARKRREDEQRLLAKLGAVLASTLDYGEVLRNIAQLAVRELADLCIVFSVEEEGTVERQHVACRDPAKAWVVAVLTGLPLDRTRNNPIWETLETRRPVVRELSPEATASMAQSEEHLRAIRAIDARSLIAAPLVAHGKVLGVLSLASSTPSRVYGPEDVLLVEELAARAALAMENARLYRAAQRASQLRDEVLGIVAHDLRNPLGTILMQAAILQRRTEPERQSPKRAEVIERAASRMNRLIQDLLEVTRMEAGRLSVDRARVPVEQVVSAAVEAQEGLASSSSLELRVDLAEHLPEAWADRNRLLQVFENLIGNALKLTGPGGRITVGAAPRQGEILFWVADTGPGIEAEDLPHLFDRFYQAQQARHRGAGLGLPIVKGIVEAHGGRVWVESAPGRGSTFFFTVPAAPGAEEPLAGPHGAR